MAKIAQLIEAGDYLVYKGDWVTNTYYNVNEVVTGTDGQLYEVIKAHTSSDTLKPGNTEYYKAMTSTIIQSRTFDVTINSDKTPIINFIKQNAHRIQSIFFDNDEYFIASVYDDSVSGFTAKIATKGAGGGYVIANQIIEMFYINSAIHPIRHSKTTINNSTTAFEATDLEPSTITIYYR